MAIPNPVPVDPGLLAQQWEAMLALEKYIADLQAEVAALDRSETGRIADLQAELDRAALEQNQLQFEITSALQQQQFDFAVEQFAAEFGLSREEFEFFKEQFVQEFGLERERFGLERRMAEAELAANPANFVALELYKRSLQEQGITPTTGRGLEDPAIQNLFATTLDLGEDVTSFGTGQFGVTIPTAGSISRSELQGLSQTDIDLLSSFLRGGVDVGEGEFVGINPADYFQEVQEGLIPTVEPGITQFRF